MPAKNSATAVSSEAAGGLRYVARQPILDLRGRVHGYELLFRKGPEAAFRGDGDMATRTMLDNAVIFGLETLTGGLPAFVNCTRESLDELVHVLPPSLAVLEILETLEPTPDLIQACRKLKALGFRLALDDFTWKPKIEPLVELADYIKVDFTLSNSKARKDLRRRLSGVSAALIAEKVETQEECKQAREEGFTLIQGYYFCRPVLLKGQKIPANRLSHIRILELLQYEPLNLHRLSAVVKQDAALTFRLLRLVNSPVCAMRQEISSIESALMVVGDEAFRRIATLAITSELNANHPPELLRMAIVRGRFCELAAELCALVPTEQYLVGMLSLVPTMLRVSIEEFLLSLPLQGRMCGALLGEDCAERGLLLWAERYERGDWAGCDAVAQANGLDQEAVARRYAEAVVWAEAALAFTR